MAYEPGSSRTARRARSVFAASPDEAIR